mgnify:CR=1 FL=1
MQLYLIVLIIFLFINFSLSIFLNKYNFSKFFIFVISYFTLINIINLIYFKNIEFFTFQTLFFVCLLFLYVGLYSSVSVKIMIYLYSKKTGVNVNSFYENQNITAAKYIRIKTTDKGSGIKTYRGEIDGKWVLLEFNLGSSWLDSGRGHDKFECRESKL